MYQQAPAPVRPAPAPSPLGGQRGLLLLLAAGLVPLGAGLGAVSVQGTVRRLRLAELVARDARREERSRIARELHDSLSQELFSLRARLAGLEAGHRDDGELRRQLAALHAGAAAALRQVRGLLLDLAPASLDGADLEVALQELGAACGSRLGIPVQVRVQPVALGPRSRETLLRVAQEALANAARHARARRLDVDLVTAGRVVELRVADDGRGLVPGAEGRGLGLRLARERLGELGGALRLESAPGRGTRVIATLPTAGP